VPTITDFSALAGAGVFLLRKKKGTKEIRPKQPAPENHWGKPQLPTLPTKTKQVSESNCF